MDDREIGAALFAESEPQPYEKAIRRKNVQWRDPRIHRLASLIAALDREMQELMWLEETYGTAARRERAEASRQAAQEKAFQTYLLR
jgi:hypothetical protein